MTNDMWLVRGRIIQYKHFPNWSPIIVFAANMLCYCGNNNENAALPFFICVWGVHCFASVFSRFSHHYLELLILIDFITFDSILLLVEHLLPHRIIKFLQIKSKRDKMRARIKWTAINRNIWDPNFQLTSKNADSFICRTSNSMWWWLYFWAHFLLKCVCLERQNRNRLDMLACVLIPKRIVYTFDLERKTTEAKNATPKLFQILLFRINLLNVWCLCTVSYVVCTVFFHRNCSLHANEREILSQVWASVRASERMHAHTPDHFLWFVFTLFVGIFGLAWFQWSVSFQNGLHIVDEVP